jgi:Ca2+-transporting ATPase
VVLDAGGVRGLSDTEAEKRRARYGPNVLPDAPSQPHWRRFLGQFTEFLVVILLFAATVSATLGEWADASAVLAIVVVNAVIGFLQEARAAQALEALRKLSAPQAKVVREGELRVVPTRDLVPGDRIELEAGDFVPADARLFGAAALRVQEAAVTGESLPQDKDPGCILAPDTALADRRNMVYAGTVVASGRASAVLVATGPATEMGRIAGMLQQAHPAPTPLQRQLAELGRTLVAACLGIVAVVFVLELLRGARLLDVFLVAVSLAVAAVPEGLPAVVTLTLAVGLQRMVRRNALVRKLPSVETLGSVTVICSDKTGTLTRNEMTVREVLAAGKNYHVTGAGYAPHGQFLRSGVAVDPRADADLVRTLTIAARCNHTRVRPRGDGSEAWEVVGDPTEAALVVAALKGGVGPDEPGARLVAEVPFDSERQMMSVVERRPSGEARLYAKGAPEVVLARCAAERRDGRVEPLTPVRRDELAGAAASMAGRALRVLALADRDLPDAGVGSPEETDLVFAGLAGMMDPPREEAREAVRTCRAAGIRPVMITGDHRTTALAVARELGIAGAGDDALTGRELDGLSEAELTARVDRVAVYARVAAEHKLRVVRAWQARGEVVAMTGDGVNDAPAVRAADIGIAMGASGTDVTREAAAMVLTDDNFASIVAAVEEGRGIFDNIQKFLHYLLAGNIGLVLFVFAAVLFDWPFPLGTVQILWINLVTNGLPALALGMEPPEPGLMRRRPRPPREPVLTARRWGLILAHGVLVGAVTALGFALVYRGRPEHLPQARTFAFCVVSYGFLFYAFGCRSHRYTLPELGLFSNPYLFGAVAVSALLQLSVVTLPFARPVFEAVQHFTWEWALLVVLALTPVTVIEAIKLFGTWCRA